MSHFFYLEGPDAAGKTTLAEAITRRFGVDNVCSRHLSYISGAQAIWRANYLELYLASSMMARGKVCILDRGWISENVYSSVYRGGSEIGLDVRGLDRVVRRLCGVTVLCCPSTVQSAVERHHRASSQREEMYQSDEKIGRAAQRFLDLYDSAATVATEYAIPYQQNEYVQHWIDRGGMHARPDVTRYDIDDEGGDLDGVIDRLVKISTKLRATQMTGLTHARRNFTGHLGDARVLMVGDKCNPKKTGKWPFIDIGASSRVMSSALHDIGVDETDLVWTNANDESELERILAQRNLRVVALGGEAHKTLERKMIPHIQVYHPSFAGRFNRHDEFRTQLIEALYQ